MYDKQYYDNRKKDLQLKMADLQSELITQFIGMVENYKIDATNIQSEYEELKAKENGSDKPEKLDV